MTPIGGLPRFPVLYQINARTHVAALHPGATLDDIDDATLDRLEADGVDWLYLLGVWQTGAAGRAVSRANPAIRQDCAATLPDLTDDDICGSCFAVTGYRVHAELGGEKALAGLRERLAGRGIRLMVDFVPNHTAPDHPWATEHPDRYIEGTEEDLLADPGNWIRIPGPCGDRILAYGRDPYFPGWPDTLQLDYSSPALQQAMRAELRTAAGQADGLRCDMAMLVLPDVFERTWGRPMAPFWPDALGQARSEHPDLVLMAEVYWDREYDLQQQGFDSTYDKRLYDRLAGAPGEVRSHLCADPGFQTRSARFLENHDEPRAAAVFGIGDRHRAAATIAFLIPGLRFFHDGQYEGRRLHVPVHLARAPVEPVDEGLAAFYAHLLAVLRDPVLHDGDWQLLDIGAAWAGNPSHADLLAFSWSDPAGGPLRYLITVNLADHWAQGYVSLPATAIPGQTLHLADRLGDDRHERDADELRRQGLYLDLAPWAHHTYQVTIDERAPRA